MFRFLLGCIALCGAFGWLVPAQAQPEAPKPQLDFPSWVEGKVIAVTGKTIVIQNAKGESVDFRLSETLQKNLVPKTARGRAVCSEESYRPADVQVGDVIEIVQNHDGKAFVCEAIMIRRRPGGIVPEAPNQTFDPKRPQLSHAFRMNAHQAFEEKGTPLPDCLIPQWELDRRAPMPREVKLKPSMNR